MVFLVNNFFYSASIFYQNSFGLSDIEFNKLEFGFDFELRIFAALKLSINTLVKYQDSTLIPDLNNYFLSGSLFNLKESLTLNYIYFHGNKDFFIRGDFTFLAGLFYFFPANNLESINNLIFNIHIKNIFMVETRYLSFGFGSNFFYASSILDYFDSYNLSYSQDCFIRSLVSKSQSFPDSLLVFNFEIRTPEFTIPLGGIFNFCFSLFIFDDFSICKFLYKNPYSLPSTFHTYDVPVNNNLYLLNALGTGIRFGFSIPINLFFTLTYGINRDGIGTFILFYGKGF